MLVDDIERAQAAYTEQIAAALRRIEDPVQRIKRVNRAITDGGLSHAVWASITRDTVRELLDGRTKADVARLLGISEARINKLAEKENSNARD